MSEFHVTVRPVSTFPLASFNVGVSVPVWKRVLERYLEGLAVERGLSANTVAGYRNDLTRLGEALAKRMPVAVIRKVTAAAFAVLGVAALVMG